MTSPRQPGFDSPQNDFDLQLFGYRIAPDQFQALNPLFIVVLLPVVSVGLWRLLDRMGLHMRPTDKMLVGFVLTAASMAMMTIAGFLATPEHKVSLWWQVVTFFLITVAELCISPVGLELAFTAAPQSMKGFITACFLLTVFFGNILNSGLTRLYGPLGPGRYFGLLTGILLVVTIAFIFVARQFNRMNEECASGSGRSRRPVRSAFGAIREDRRTRPVSGSRMMPRL